MSRVNIIKLAFRLSDVYWGQIAVALLVALSTAAYVYTRGRTILFAAIVGLVVYIVMRWLIAWGYRIRYWYKRGTKGIYSTSCPNCGQYIYRNGAIGFSSASAADGQQVGPSSGG